MKRILFVVLLAVAIIGATASWMQATQPKPYKVVFDLNSADQKTLESLPGLVR